MSAYRLTSVAIACAVAALVLGVVVMASLALGSRQIAPNIVWESLVHGGTSQDARVVLSLRVPRTIAALIIGGALGLAGSIMQAITRNPLADPGILGVNAGAAFAVVSATAVMGVSTRAVTLGAALIGAGVASALVFALSGRGARASRARLALAGIAVSAALASLTSAILTANQFAFNEFRYWASGSFEGIGVDSLVLASVVIGGGTVLGALLTSALGILTLGDEVAVGLGVRVRLVRGLATLAVTALAGGATALGGPLTFVGLAVPLLVRRAVGARHSLIALWSVIVGAVWVCVADVASRLVLAPQEVPVGVIVALIGAPFFIVTGDVVNSGRYVVLALPWVSLRIHRRSATVVVAGLLLAVCLSVYSLTLGDYGLSAAESFRRLMGDSGPRDDFLGVYFVQSVRLPRVCAALGVGCALGLSGAIFQTVSGNPLGSPDIVGLSTGSATGALLAIIVCGSSPATTGVGALVGGLVSGVLILACAGGVRVTGIRVVLVGIGFSAALRAINSLLIVKAPLEAAQRAQLWSAGSFSGVTMVRIAPFVLVLAVTVLVLARLARPLAVLAMGDDVAMALGVRVREVRIAVIAAAMVLVSTATAVAGPVAFVALAAPHVARRVCGHGGVGLASSAVVGALLVLASDVVAQRLLAPHEMPVGVVTGVVGGIYLLVLLVREVR